ncbi:MAG: peptidase inhibitor family I36 protein [Nocardioidaceae bacterium]
MTSRIPALLIAVFIFAAISTPGPATADESPVSPEIQQILDDQLALDPGGVVVGDEIHYADGSVFVAVLAGTYSQGQCSTNQFCLWGASNYQGSFTYKTGNGVTRTLGSTLGSFWNNRSHAARLYTNTGSSSTCYAAGTAKATVGSSYSAAEKVFLSASTSC